MTLISIKWLHETKMYQVSVVPLKVPNIEFYSMLGFWCMCSRGLRFRCTDKIIFKTNTFFHGEIVYFEKDLCLTNQSISESMCCCQSNNQSLTSKIPIPLKLKKIKIFSCWEKKQILMPWKEKWFVALWDEIRLQGKEKFKFFLAPC